MGKISKELLYLTGCSDSNCIEKIFLSYNRFKKILHKLAKFIRRIKNYKTVEIIISWTPTKEGNARDVIYWKTSLGVRSQTVILGTCVDPTAKKVKFP